MTSPPSAPALGGPTGRESPSAGSDAWARFTQWKDGALGWDSVALGRSTWEHDDDGRWNAGDDDEARARILGHQFLWMVLAPEEVFHAFGEPRSDTLDGTAVEWIPARETSEHPVDSRWRPADARWPSGSSGEEASGPS